MWFSTVNEHFEKLLVLFVCVLTDVFVISFMEQNQLQASPQELH